MASLAIAFPILPGKTEQARAFAQEALARSREMADSFARAGTLREEWFLQETPHGAMVIIWMEAEDPPQAFARWAGSQDPFDLWFKGQAGQISGIDFNQPLPGLPEQVFRWPSR